MKIRHITLIVAILSSAAGCSDKSRQCDVLFNYTYSLGEGTILRGAINGLNEDFHVQNVPVTEQISASACSTLKPVTYQQVYDSIVFTKSTADNYSTVSIKSTLHSNDYVGIFHLVAIGWIKDDPTSIIDGFTQDEQYVGISASGEMFLPASQNDTDRFSADLKIGMIQFSFDENNAVVMTLTGQRTLTETMEAD